MQELSALALAVLGALRPRSLQERARTVLVGGWSARQVLDRLALEERAAALAAFEGDTIVRERRLSTEVHHTLVMLTAAGRVRRQVSRYGVELRSKGHRHAVVDVFRLA